MNAEVKDTIDMFKKVIDTHIAATEIEITSFPESQYWKGQLDAQKNIRDALFVLAGQHAVTIEK
jgi:hypothetical protein